MLDLRDIQALDFRRRVRLDGAAIRPSGRALARSAVAHDVEVDTEALLVVDLNVVRDNYQTFAKALPDTRVFYAVKANPAPEVPSA